MTATVAIGFDLGHGEMALTRQAITGRAEPEVIEIHGRRSQVTAIAEVVTLDGAPTVLIGEDAVEAFDVAAPEAAVLEIGFKGHPARDPTTQAYVPLLARAVYQYILDRDVLAVEVYRPGASRTVLRAHAAGLPNVRVIEADGRALVATGLATGSVAGLHVYFPDPWPKTRHHKRRLVDAGFVADAARVLAPGGVLRLATDWEHYAQQMLEVGTACPDLVNPRADVAGGWAPRCAGRPETLFERKGIAAGRTIYDLEFRRR